jgi:hypothetical protein
MADTLAEFKGRPSEFRPPRPYQPGNLEALKHGAYSPRKIDPLARELVASVLSQVAYLSDPSYAPALWAWGRAEARVQLLTEFLDEQGVLGDEGNPRPLLDKLRDWERSAESLRSRLGLDPTSRARLERDLSASARDLRELADEIAEGRRLRLAAEERDR